jgi:hypothetical protein
LFMSPGVYNTLPLPCEGGVQVHACLGYDVSMGSFPF